MKDISIPLLFVLVSFWATIAAAGECGLTVQDIQRALFRTVHCAAIGEAIYELREEGLPEKTAVENLTKEFKNDPAVEGVTAVIQNIYRDKANLNTVDKAGDYARSFCMFQELNQ